MSSFRTRLLPRIERARAKTGPGRVDIRTHSITIVSRVWAGQNIDEGVSTDTVLLVLPAHYPVRTMTGQEVDGSAGLYKLDDYTVNHITPYDADSGVGYTRDQLEPVASSRNEEIVYIVVGTDGGEFTRIDGKFLRPFSYGLVLRRRMDTP